MAELRQVVGFPGYLVGSDGSVWSLWVRGSPYMGGKARRMRTKPQASGYVMVGLCSGGWRGRKHFLV
ncbi:MAG: hypothetical protein ACJ786_17430, partial [Catenulispora sp.]